MNALLLLALAVPLQDDAAQAALRGLSERMKDARTLSAKVVQGRKTALLDAPIVSSGTLLYRRDPGRLVFRMTEPRATEIHLDASSYQVYRPDEKRLEQFDFEGGDAAGKLLMIFRPRTDEIGRAFAVRRGDSKPGEISLILEPGNEKVRKRVAKLVLALDEKDATLKRIATTDPEGDEVTFELSDLKINPEIDAGAFELKVPEGTRVLKHPAKPDK